MDLPVSVLQQENNGSVIQELPVLSLSADRREFLKEATR